MIKALFFLCLFMIFYVYVGYPLAVLAVSRLRPRPVRKGTLEPGVSIVIAAYNEEAAIGATIANKLALDYPKEKLEIIVVSDGSTDRTDEIVRRFAGQNVRLLRQEPRAGKTSALNLAVPQVSGEIIVFSDANSLYAADALHHLLRNFADPEVGYVTGKMIYTDPDGRPIGDGCSAYMRYENRLRELETAIGSVVGVDGGVDAIRKELYRPMNADQLPDFVLPLKVVEQGYRVVYEEQALLQESSLKEDADEYRMRVRVSLRALWALYDMRNLLKLDKNRLFAWQLWSHKLLRYLCFGFLGGAFLSNAYLLTDGGWYKGLFLVQICGYLVAIAKPLIEARGLRSRLLTFTRYFVLLNLASAHAFGKFIAGKKQVVWTPRKG